MNNIILKQISAIEKVFLSDKSEKPEFNSFSALCGEKFSYQIMYTTDVNIKFDAEFSITSPIKDMITVYRVGNVPSLLPCYKDHVDDDYLTTEPGLLPDVLFPISEGFIEIYPLMQSLWIDINIPNGFKGGKYPVTFTFKTEEVTESVTFELEIIGVDLKEQELIYTQWFHSDCIAQYFGVEVFSEKHWQLIEEFVKVAVDCGINMLLTPVFTPPLDTQVGGERPTVQLVDVYKNGNSYTFGFEKLDRWIKMCKRCGIKYFEISHLFTQWGAYCTPKIIASVNGREEKIFGWDVAATSKEYADFLDAFLPGLTSFIEKAGIKEYTYFHVSDEPHESHLKNYSAARKLLLNHIKDYKIMDALSNYEFYQLGIVDTPVVSLDALDVFIKNNVPDLWTYTCCSPAAVYSNRFMAMPSGRNRIIGIQMYKYDIKGFLHWGFNFYNSNFSRRVIDPYQVTDSDYAFPSGDSYAVYPYKDGAIPSIRSRVFFDALQDMRALSLLESKIGKDKVIEIINDGKELTLSDYPRDYTYILKLRKKINALIAEA